MKVRGAESSSMAVADNAGLSRAVTRSLSQRSRASMVVDEQPEMALATEGDVVELETNVSNVISSWETGVPVRRRKS